MSKSSLLLAGRLPGSNSREAAVSVDNLAFSERRVATHLWPCDPTLHALPASCLRLAMVANKWLGFSLAWVLPFFELSTALWGTLRTWSQRWKLESLELACEQVVCGRLMCPCVGLKIAMKRELPAHRTSGGTGTQQTRASVRETQNQRSGGHGQLARANNALNLSTAAPQDGVALSATQAAEPHKKLLTQPCNDKKRGGAFKR